MAEEKMRESIEGKVQAEIDADEQRLAQQQDEFDNLQSQDGRVEKRQSWLQAISGQTTQPEQPMQMDPSALGARPGMLGSSAGRPMRGALAQAAAQHTPSMGLSGMRAPQSTAKSLSGATPMARPVKAPIGGQVIPGAGLPKPVQPKMVRQPIQPISQPVPPVEEETMASPVVKMPQITPIVSQPKVEEITPEPVVSAPKLEIAGISPTTEVAPEEISPVSELEEFVEPEIDTIDDLVEEDLESIEELSDLEPETIEEEPQQVVARLTPIKKLIVAEEVVAEQVVSEEVVVEQLPVLQPVEVKTLQPVEVKKLNPISRGLPPSSKPGQKPSAKLEPKVATLTPITKLKPVEEGQNKDEN
jgi:hypothetical protein